MKRVSLVFSFVFFALCGAFAQIQNPVTWSYAAKRVSKTEVMVFLKATMDDRWHIYSQHGKQGGPTSTTFTFSPTKDFSLIGKPEEPKPIVKYEKTMKMNVGYFEKEVVFKQKIKLNKQRAKVNGKVEFMTCNDKECLPATEVEFSIPVK